MTKQEIYEYCWARDLDYNQVDDMAKSYNIWDISKEEYKKYWDNRTDEMLRDIAPGDCHFTAHNTLGKEGF